MFDYDRWLESPYTDPDEGHTHQCECEGIELCDKCEDGEIQCWEDCYDDYYEDSDD